MRAQLLLISRLVMIAVSVLSQAVSSKLELLLAESTYAHSTEERSTNSRQVQALNQEISEMEEYHFNEMKVCTYRFVHHACHHFVVLLRRLWAVPHFLCSEWGLDSECVWKYEHFWIQPSPETASRNLGGSTYWFSSIQTSSLACSDACLTQ